jgi:hypothetical protein
MGSSRPLIKQVRDLAVAAGRATANGVEPNITYTRTDARLGIIYCASQPDSPFAPTPGQALLPMAMEAPEQALSGNFFHLYTTNSGETSGYNQRVGAHEVGHLLTNKGHFGGDASSPINYQSMAGSDERGYNLMTQGPWPSVDWPLTHQRLSEEQEAFIFTNGAVWLRNP